MALETLKELEQIDGFKIIRVKPEDMSWDDFDKLRDEFPINITERMNCISFKIQKGPIKEVGKNGCQLDQLISVAHRMITVLNEKHYSTHNNTAIYHLSKALQALNERTAERSKRGVEGTSAA